MGKWQWRREPLRGGGFREQQLRNRWRLWLVLAVYFLLALAAGRITGEAFQRLADPNAYYAEHYDVYTGQPAGRGWLNYVNAVAFALLLLAWAQYRRMRRRGHSAVLSMVDARPLKELELENTGAEMAIAAGLSAPRLWIVESDELNAFACADGDGKASIAMTRALLDRLDRDEIQAVVAHEMGHIRNGDTRLITLLLGLGKVFHLISVLALGPLRLFFDAAMSSDSDGEPVADTQAAEAEPSFWERDWSARQTVMAVLATPLVALLLLVVGVAFSIALFLFYGMLIVLFPWLVGIFALWQLVGDRMPGLGRWVSENLGRYPWVALLLFVPGGLIIGPAILILGILAPSLFALMRLVVSRNREFQADATAVELTRNPQALCWALVKIRASAEAASPLPRALGSLTIVPPLRSRSDGSVVARLRTMLDTHPPIETRIERLMQMGAPRPYTDDLWRV